MSRHLKIGIDHGSTNSAIAVMEANGEVAVIPPDGSGDVLPSVVYYTADGRPLIGRPARSAMVGGAQRGNGHTGYKRNIGQNLTYEYPAAQITRTGVELGALVLSELLKQYRETRQEDPLAAVITVPAEFSPADCKATQEAAAAAGLRYAPLLQEPIAAAWCYGFSVEDKRANWLIFDLGGGTLDVSLVVVRDGRMAVPEEGHLGDNHLGGRDFDGLILDHVLKELRRQTYQLADFSEGSLHYRHAWDKLMMACEEAKIRLSSRESTTVRMDEPLCTDDAGTEVTVDVPLTRADYEAMISQPIRRSLHICDLLLRNNNMAPADVTRLVLVGGPTKTPFIQAALANHFGQDAAHTVDPMTVVAMGAAVFAATQEVPREIWRELAPPAAAAADRVQLELQYEGASEVPNAAVMGRVTGDYAEGLAIEITRDDGLWTSGRVPLLPNGKFRATVALLAADRPTYSTFRTRVLDAAARELTVLDEPRIWHPFPGGGGVAARVANSLRVGRVNNQTGTLIRRGSELPARGNDRFRSAKALRRGNRDDALRIPVLEAVTSLAGGEDEHADCHVMVGTLVIRACDDRVTIDLPEETEIDVEVFQDESRLITARAYIPLLDEEFEVTCEASAYDIDAARARDRYVNVRDRLEAAQGLQRRQPLNEVGELLAPIHEQQSLAEAERSLTNAESGSADSLVTAYRRLLELAGTLNLVEEAQYRVRLQDRIRDLRTGAGGSDPAVLDGLAHDCAELDPRRDRDELERVEAEIDRFEFRMRSQAVIELFLDVYAIAKAEGEGGTPDGLVAFLAAGAHIEVCSNWRNDHSSWTQEQCAEAKRLHDDLWRTWARLPGWREQYQPSFDEIPSAGRPESGDLR